MKKSHPEIIYQLENISKVYPVYGNKPTFIKSILNPKTAKLFSALKNINLTVYRGNFVGIYGNNGAGKSTLLKIISGIVQPSSGTIRSTGNTLSLINLTAGLLPELNGEENIVAQLTFHGINERKLQTKLINQIVKFSELGDHIFEPVFTYSSGMLLRLAFSIITVIPADNYIIDEFISVGDSDFRDKCFKFIHKLHLLGKTVIVASHDLGWLIHNTDQVVIMDRGKIINDNSIPSTYLDFYTNAIRKQAKSATVTSGSMLPTLKIGQQVKIHLKPYSKIKTGDIIVFLFKNYPQPIIHRVVGIGKIENKPVLFTKGDASDQPDPWTISKEDYLGTVTVD